MRVGRGMRAGAQVHDLPSALGVVLRPARQSGTVGITGLREIDPVRRHEVRHFAVFGPPGKVLRIERLKHKLDFRRVIRAQMRSGIIGRGFRGRGRRLVELVPVDGRFTSLPVQFDPLPSGEGDEPVTGQILSRTFGFLVCRRGIQFQERFGPGAELGLRLLC